MQPRSSQLLDAPRDAASITQAECLPRSLGDLPGRLDSFQVVISRPALEKIHAHGKSSLKAEVGGVLVGRPCRDRAGPYLWIDAVIAGKSMRHHSAQVTFTADTWTAIQETMDRDYPDEKIVGWYHTHPGFGIFLSEMDRFIHENFFNLPWQVALVHDPKSGEDGVFVWREGKTRREEFLCPGGLPAGESAAGPRPPAPAALSSAFPPTSLEELAARQLDLERRLRSMDRRFTDRLATLRRRNLWVAIICLFILAVAIAIYIMTLSLLTRPPRAPSPAAALNHVRPIEPD